MSCAGGVGGLGKEKLAELFYANLGDGTRGCAYQWAPVLEYVKETQFVLKSTKGLKVIPIPRPS